MVIEKIKELQVKGYSVEIKEYRPENGRLGYNGVYKITLRKPRRSFAMALNTKRMTTDEEKEIAMVDCLDKLLALFEEDVK